MARERKVAPRKSRRFSQGVETFSTPVSQRPRPRMPQEEEPQKCELICLLLAPNEIHFACVDGWCTGDYRLDTAMYITPSRAPPSKYVKCLKSDSS